MTSPPHQYGPPPAPHGPSGPYAGLPRAPQQVPPYPVPPRPGAGTNGLAIAALVLACVGVVFLGGILAFVALSQVKRTGQKGRGLALAALAVCGAWIVAGVVALAVVFALAPDRADRDDAGQVSGAGELTATELRVGDCVNGVGRDETVYSMPVVPCAEPHEGEVFAVFQLAAGAYPGEEQVFTLAQERCSSEFETYAPSMVDDPKIELFLLQPTRLSWTRADDREITCVATDPAARRTGSIKG